MEVRKDNFLLCQVQRKSRRKFIWNSAQVKRLRTPFLKKCVHTSLSFLQLLFIIINTQRHFQGYTNCMQEFCRSQFPESNCEKVISIWKITKALQLQIFLILMCQQLYLLWNCIILKSFVSFPWNSFLMYFCLHRIFPQRFTWIEIIVSGHILHRMLLWVHCYSNLLVLCIIHNKHTWLQRTTHVFHLMYA